MRRAPTVLTVGASVRIHVVLDVIG